MNRLNRIIRQAHERELSYPMQVEISPGRYACPEERRAALREQRQYACIALAIRCHQGNHWPLVEMFGEFSDYWNGYRGPTA